MIGRYSDEMTFDYIMNRMLESVPDTVDKREGASSMTRSHRQPQSLSSAIWNWTS